MRLSGKINKRKVLFIKNFSHAQADQSKGRKIITRVLATLLCLLILTSVIIVAIPTVFARGEAPFIDCEEIFIDMRGFTDWTKDNASFRVFTFYNDSDNPHWSHEYAKNFDDNSYDSGTLSYGIKPVKFADNVYSFRIPANNLSHLRVVRTNSNGTQKWNLSPYMWNNDSNRTKYTAGGKSYSAKNAIRITGWDNSASWSTYTPDNNASYSETTANPDSTITGNSNLYTIDATFYDYYNDDEIQNGWGNIRYQTNHGTQRNSNNGTGYMENAYWEPFQYLNSKIASHDSGVNYPLYFGNFYDKEDGYKGEGSSNMVNFSNWVNNSSRLGGTHKSVIGLTGNTLVNGNLVYASSGGSNSSVNVPIFDKNWLSSNKVGAVVNTKFPMRKVTDNGVTGYYFDSSSSASNGGDNVWFNSDHNTISYGAGTSNGAKDSLAYYNSNGSSSGYGFFPFDSTRGTNANALDYGFGMRVDINFNLGHDSGHYGQLKGDNGSYVDQVFNFTGDDDVWVYVDGKLILDLGGDHQKASGTINFHNSNVSVTTGTNTINNATRNTSFSLDDTLAEHTLTMFYVERGMVESNLSFNFNFAPSGNEFIVDKTVNTANINTGLKDAVAQTDYFSFNQPTANGKLSTKGTISNSTYTLIDGESISFKDQFTVPTNMVVTENEPGFLKYTTTWTATDLVMQSKGQASSLGSGSTKIANFTYKTLDTSSSFATTRVQLSYVNTPVTGSVKIKKVVENGTGNEVNKEFDAKIEVSLDGGTAFSTYPLTYTASDKSGRTFTLSNYGDLADGAKLKNDRTLTFSGLPTGAILRVSEQLDTQTSQRYSFKSATGTSVVQQGNGGTITVGSGEPRMMTITNTALSSKKTISGTKIFEGQNYSGDLFRFVLEGMYVLSGDVSTAQDTSDTVLVSDTVTNGNFSFPEITYTEPGVYRYYVSETLDKLYIIDDENSTTCHDDIYQASTPGPRYLVTIIVTSTNNGLIASDPVIVTTSKDINDITLDDFDASAVNGIKFVNKIHPGSVTIEKKNQAGEKVDSVKFALYKVNKQFLEETRNLSDEELYDAIVSSENSEYLDDQTTNSDGIASFSNLKIYEEGYINSTISSPPSYQSYALIEVGENNNYRTNKTPQIFSFPKYDTQEQELKYDYTFKYENGIIRNPYTAGNGMMMFIFIGLSFIGISLLVLAGILIYKKRFSLNFINNIKK